jgi:hypothetical protein
MWNPIGMPELPRDEYDSYAPEIARMLSDKASTEQLTETLKKFENGMHSPTSDAHRLGVARALQALPLG